MGSTLPGLPAASTRHSGTLPARTGVFPAQPLECGGYRRFDFTCPTFSPKRRGAPHSNPPKNPGLRRYFPDFSGILNPYSSKLSTNARQLASMMLSETPTVPQVSRPFVETINTRVRAAVPRVPSTMRTL